MRASANFPVDLTVSLGYMQGRGRDGGGEVPHLRQLFFMLTGLRPNQSYVRYEYTCHGHDFYHLCYPHELLVSFEALSNFGQLNSKKILVENDIII